MAGVDRRVTGGEQRYERRLRLLEVERRLIVTRRGDPIEVPIPALARIDAEFGGRLAEQHVPSALNVLSGKRLPIMPLDALAQAKGQLFAVLIPRPALGKVRRDRGERVLRHMLIEHNEVAEHRHHRRDGRDRHFLERRHAGGAVQLLERVR